MLLRQLARCEQDGGVLMLRASVRGGAGREAVVLLAWVWGGVDWGSCGQVGAGGMAGVVGRCERQVLVGELAGEEVWG
ncbi:hypothetical protein GCM10009554_55540 [Kribbella koreensis]|uniref:Uncharacterized protein n=1 Tax=Kribbella koreensis TaxID=57909 RepID=A0ABN1R690_9ACTN